MRQRRFDDHIKPVRAKGTLYLYFRTGQKNERGHEILKPLPRPDEDNFGSVYGSLLAGRRRRERIGSDLTVQQLCDLWERTPRFKRYAAGTQKLYRIALDYFCSMFGPSPAALIERTDIQPMIGEREDQPGAANTLLRVIRSLYSWAREAGKLTNDPTADIPLLEVGEHEPWPEGVLNAALEADNARVRLAVHLLYYTALRIEDVVQLRHANIQGGVLHVTPMKTKKPLTMPVHRALAAEIERQGRPHDFIIPGAKPGKPLHQQTLRREIQAWVRENCEVEIVPHGLRKNAVNTLLEIGCPIGEVSSISGQSLKTIEHYAKGRAQPKMARGAMARWENI